MFLGNFKQNADAHYNLSHPKATFVSLFWLSKQTLNLQLLSLFWTCVPNVNFTRDWLCKAKVVVIDGRDRLTDQFYYETEGCIGLVALDPIPTDRIVLSMYEEALLRRFKLCRVDRSES